jgi:hypothetical protein
MDHISFAQLRAFFLSRRGECSHGVPFLDTDVHVPLNDCDVNCWDPNLSQSSGLCPRARRHVLLSPIPLSPALTVVDDL